jgi:hypothetical protein
MIALRVSTKERPIQPPGHGPGIAVPEDEGPVP